MAEGCDLVRLVVGERGQMDFYIELVIRFDYGVSVPWVIQLQDKEAILAVSGPDGPVLRTSTPLQGEDFCSIGEFSVKGESRPFRAELWALLWTSARAIGSAAGARKNGDILAQLAAPMSERRRLGFRG